MSTIEPIPKRWAVVFALTHVTLISVPLLAYVAFWSLVVLPYKGPSDIWHKPEWMFIAVMLQIEAMRDSIAFATRHSRRIELPLRDAHLISHIVVLVMFVLVLFAVLGRYEQAFKGAAVLDVLQWSMLGFGLLSCWRWKYRIILSDRRSREESA